MAFDGITIANLVYELNQTVLNSKINKIAQPENDALLFTIKNNGQPTAIRYFWLRQRDLNPRPLGP